MEEIRFKWTSNELLTKARMEQFTDFLHQRFGYLHILKQGDFGFGLINRQPINHEQLNNQIKVSIPQVPIIFPDGFLFIWNEPIDLDIDYEQGLLCLSLSSLSGEKIISLSYCKNEGEAFEKKCLPFLKTTQSTYLLPVLAIEHAKEYDTVRESLNQSIDSILDSIRTFFLEDNFSLNPHLSKLTTFIFQSYLLAVQKIKFEIAATTNLGSCSYFNLFKSLLLLTDSNKVYFDKMDELGGRGNRYSFRESLFLNDLRCLIDNINFLHTHDNINLLIQWMKVLNNTIRDYSKPHAGIRKPVLEEGGQTPPIIQLPNTGNDNPMPTQPSKKLI